jgi:hypothetical protein
MVVSELDLAVSTVVDSVVESGWWSEEQCPLLVCGKGCVLWWRRGSVCRRRDGCD